MQPLDLLDTAETLLRGKSRPSDANLRRAHSTVYYAMFHFLAKTCADQFIGGTAASRSQQAWKQTYRALMHGMSKDACKKGEMISRFPDPIRDFANLYGQMQSKRHLADYDPLLRLSKSEVASDIELARQSILDFKQAPKKDQRAFCAYVMFRQPKKD